MSDDLGEQRETEAESRDRSVVSDADLLRRFLNDQDNDALAVLVSRYEALVMGVALRQVGDRHQAEDVFQATFLVLAEQAAKIRNPDSLASWLHGTARRIGLRAATMRKPLRHHAEDETGPVVDEEPLRALEQVIEQQALDDELAKLPETLREPLILHYLEGMTAGEVADRLSLPVTTIEGRLKKGRSELRRRLVKHGIGFGTVVAAFGLSQKLAAAATTTSTLTAATAHAAVSWTSQQQLTGCSANAARLAAQEISLMTASKITTTLLTTTAVCLAAGIGGTIAWGQFGGGFGPPAKSTQWVQHDVDSEVVDDDATGGGRYSLSAESGGGPRTGADSGIGEFGFGGEMGASMGLNSEQILQGSQDYRTLSPSHARIEEVLRAGTFDFPATKNANSLQDLVDVLSGHLGIPVHIDLAGLADAGFETTDVETFKLGKKLPGLQADEALSFLLRTMPDSPEELDYIIRDGVLTITTVDVADEFQEVAIYEVRHLGPNYPPHDVAMLIESMHTGWESWGGVGAIKIIPGGVVVRQTQRVHRKIRAFLKQLEQFAARTDLPPATRDPQTMRLNDDNWVSPGGGGPGGGMGGGGGTGIGFMAVDEEASKQKDRRKRRKKRNVSN